MNYIRPGLFSKNAPCDVRRLEFDIKNEQALAFDNKPDYLFIGDSITCCWELELYFNAKKFSFLNRGISGDTTEYLIRRFEADALQLKPKNIVMLIGINDMEAIDDSVWWNTKGEQIDTVAEKILQNIIKIENICKSYKQNIIICSILPSRFPAPYKEIERQQLTLLVNEKIKDFCTKNDVIYVDYYSRLVYLLYEENFYEYFLDGVHPNSKGYLIMADELKKKLNEKGYEI
jgi:lysophospholipase L1-like esterase